MTYAYGGVMERFLGRIVMALCCCMFFAVTVHGKSLNKVYLKDGGVIECRTYSKRDGKVLVLVNRDLLVELAPDEVDMKRTFSKKPVKAVKKAKAAEKAASAGKEEPAAGLRTPATPGATPAKAGKAGPAPADAGKTGAAPASTPSAQPPGPANQAPGQKPAVPPPPQKISAPASAAKPVSPGQQPPVAKAPAPPAAASGRTTLPVAAVKPPGPASRPPVAMPGMGTVILVLVIVLLLIASSWKVFTKAGEAGWQCLIPLWNLYVLVKISGKPWWWFLLTFVPVVGIIVLLLVFIALAARFNRGVLFGLGLFFLGFIFFPVLAFGSATYE
jgi:hypothetical protein